MDNMEPRLRPYTKRIIALSSLILSELSSYVRDVSRESLRRSALSWDGINIIILESIRNQPAQNTWTYHSGTQCTLVPSRPNPDVNCFNNSVPSGERILVGLSARARARTSVLASASEYCL